MIEVKVPATSANVGPGFDCMGIALNVYATFRFALIEEGLQISGCDPKWQNEQNLVVQGFHRVVDELHETYSGLQIAIDASKVPEARGLGSSAVCIVAGAMGANALYGNRLSRQEVCDLCTELEGHPDNVAPAIFGSLTVSFMNGKIAQTLRYDVAPSLRFCAMIPDYAVLTKKAREVLPASLSYEDAIYNIGRCCVLAKALELGDEALIHGACDDRLHQPYRRALFPEYEEIQTICEKHHVIAWYISGSGSTMMAITDGDANADALLQEVASTYPAWQTKRCSVDLHGAQIKEV